MGAGAAIAKGFRAYKAADEVVEVADDTVESIDDAFDAGTASNKQKGNYGEIKSADNLLSNQAVKDAGYDLARIGDDAPTGLDDTIKKGIDGIYENANPPPQFVIDEGKFNTAQLGKLKDGKQMSDGWLEGSDYKRLSDQVGPKKAKEIARALQNGEVEKVLSKVDKAGNVVTKQLDKAGNVIGNWP